MRYDAIIFDLDGTAMPSERNARPSQTMCDVVRANRDKITLCAATGRAWEQAGYVIKALGITELCIISGGTIIIDPIEERVVWQEVIPLATANRILAVAKRYPYIVSYTRELVVEGLLDAEDVQLNDDINAFYILDIVEDSKIREVTAELEKITGITVSKAHSWTIEGAIDLHITNSEATKEHAVVELCARLGIDRTKVAGVGDGFNDIHLFNAVGSKIAMGNAVPELKATADEVIGSLAEEGLATFIEQSVSPS